MAKEKRDPKQLVEAVVSGNERALAQLLTSIENADEVAAECLDLLYPRAGKAKIIGITGAPGAGKSTLVDRLAEAFLATGKKVAVLAVDPSSPYSGGALLGDRIRMVRSGASSEIFIRSMASRGSLGGLGPRTFEAAIALDAAGYEYILVETVGVGQAEVEIVRLADTVLLVMVPGMGDSVQVFKAGILEIADVFVINKSDYPGVEKLKKDLLSLLSLSKAEWKAPIVETQAVDGGGMTELVQSIDSHYAWSGAAGERAARRKRRAEAAFFRELSQQAGARTLAALRASGTYEPLMQQVHDGLLPPTSAARRAIEGSGSNDT